MNWTKISIIVGCVVGFCSLIGICFTVDSYYAHAEEVRKLETKVELTNKRLEQKILNDELRYLTNELWDLEAKGIDKTNPTRVKKMKYQIKELEEEKEQLKSK